MPTLRWNVIRTDNHVWTLYNDDLITGYMDYCTVYINTHSHTVRFYLDDVPGKRNPWGHNTIAEFDRRFYNRNTPTIIKEMSIAAKDCYPEFHIDMSVAKEIYKSLRNFDPNKEDGRV